MTKPKTTGKAEKLSEETPVEETPTPEVVEDETPVDVVDTPEVKPTPDEAVAAYRAELGKYMASFGKVNGAQWFQDGLSFADASVKHIEALQADNELLRKKLAVASESEIDPVSTSDDSGKPNRTGFASKIRMAGTVPSRN